MSFLSFSPSLPPFKEFGVPDDYRYDETSSCSDKLPSKLKKIILVERNK